MYNLVHMEQHNIQAELEKLAAMIADGFADTASRFDQVDEQLQATQRRLTVLEDGYRSIARKFETVDRQFTAVNERLSAIESAIQARDPILSSYGDRLAALEAT